MGGCGAIIGGRRVGNDGVTGRRLHSKLPHTRGPPVRTDTGVIVIVDARANRATTTSASAEFDDGITANNKKQGERGAGAVGS